MKNAHLIKFQVFSKEDENEEEILESLKKLISINLHDEKIDIVRKKAIGFEEKKIIIFTVTLTKEKHTNKFLDYLTQKLSEQQKSLLLRQKESRLDKDLNFFLRLDKTKFFKNNEFWITDAGDCFHIKISIAAFPKNRKRAFEVIYRIFS